MVVVVGWLSGVGPGAMPAIWQVFASFPGTRMVMFGLSGDGLNP